MTELEKKSPAEIQPVEGDWGYKRAKALCQYLVFSGQEIRHQIMLDL
jgi:hypothetical protein